MDLSPAPLPREHAGIDSAGSGTARWRRLVVGAVLVLMVGVVSAWLLARKRDGLDPIRQALAEYRFDDARNALSDYLRDRPTSAAAHFYMAEVCWRARAQDLPDARKYLSEARRLGYPAEDIDRAEACTRFVAHGDSDADEKELLHRLSRHTTDEEVTREALTRGYVNAGRIKEALDQLCSWLTRFPDNWYAHLWRGAVYQHMPRPGLAVADYERVLQLHPGDVEVERNLGFMLVQGDGDFELALIYLRSALQRNSSDDDARVAIARCERALQRPAAAEPLIEPVLARNPRNVDALLTFALVELDLDRPERALEYLQRAEPLIGRADTPMVALDRLKRLDPLPNNVEEVKRVLAVTHLLASTLRRLGRDKDADVFQAHYQQVRSDYAELDRLLTQVGKGTPSVAAARNIARLYPRVGMPRAAETWLKWVVKLDPHDRQARKVLADYYRTLPGAESQRLSRFYRDKARMPQ